MDGARTRPTGGTIAESKCLPVLRLIDCLAKTTSTISSSRLITIRAHALQDAAVRYSSTQQEKALLQQRAASRSNSTPCAECCRVSVHVRGFLSNRPQARYLPRSPKIALPI